MKKKIFWMLLSFLLVAALVLSSCAKEEVVEEEEEEEEEEEVVEEEEEEEEEVVVPVVGEPQRGGKLTVLTYPVWGGSAGIPDPAYEGWPSAYFSHPVLERFRKADIEGFGVRGTGEYTFMYDKQSPLKYFRGALAESWEVTADKIIFHIRPGVYWAADLRAHVMESREYIADDFVFNVNRLLDPEAIQGTTLRRMDLIESVTATDRYTVVIETKFFYSEWWWLLSGYDGAHIPPEVVEAGASDWGNTVGTGPFMVKEDTPGVGLSFVRNPNYWDTTTINGVEYEIPFVDEIIHPYIVDFSTVIAALRTGTLDVYWYVQLMDSEHLAETTPDLLSTPGTGGWTSIIALRTDRPPLDNVNVRRALMIGTDIVAVAMATHRAGPTYSWPIVEGIPGHVPLEELPPDVRELFVYDPVKARQMLADEGYPDGFTLELTDYAFIQHPREEIGGMVASLWERDFNIKTVFNPVEDVLYAATMVDLPGHYGKGHQDCLVAIHLLYNALSTEGIGIDNWAWYSNPEFDELLAKAEVTVDDAEREAILEELFVMALRDVPYIPFGGAYWHAMWWPWLKNFYGEWDGIAWGTPYDTLWIDQDLKAEMGY
ncbi:hypothetical protein ES703_26152 [subsurface metagenome]